MCRWYRSWSGNPTGAREDSRYCAAAVTSRHKGRKGMQCDLPRGYGDTGEFCWRHYAALEAGLMVVVPEKLRASCM